MAGYGAVGNNCRNLTLVSSSPIKDFRFFVKQINFTLVD